MQKQKVSFVRDAMIYAAQKHEKRLENSPNGQCCGQKMQTIRFFVRGVKMHGQFVIEGNFQAQCEKCGSSIYVPFFKDKDLEG